MFQFTDTAFPLKSGLYATDIVNAILHIYDCFAQTEGIRQMTSGKSKNDSFVANSWRILI